MTESQIFILDASAGTGKTYNLSKRYLKLLLENFSSKQTLKEIIAITFTNKACFEMKQRILEMLKKIALDKLEEEERKDILSEFRSFNTNKLKEYANLIIEEILQNYHYFQVYTIDSFIHTLVVAYAFYLGISPNFKVETNFSQYLEYSLDYLIDKAADDKRIKNLFLKFLDSYLFLENKRSFNPKRDILNIVRIFYEYSRNYYFDFKKTHISKNVLELVKELVKYVREFFNLLSQESVYQQFYNSILKFLNTYENSSKMINFEKLSKYFCYDEIPIKKKSILTKKENLLWQKIRKLISEICEIHSKSVYNNYIGIYEKVKEVLEEFTQKQDIVFLEDLNKKINKVVSEFEEFVPELFIRLATTIKHFLIDEFQDTNILQWENLVPIIKEVLSSQGSLFYVGDKKQSIYRFRGGEAVLFDMVKNYFENFKEKRDTLNKNRRSRKEIVEFNNYIFSQDNLRKFLEEVKIRKEVKLTSKLLEVYSNVIQEYLKEKDGGFVYGELIKDKENYEEIVKRKLIEIVKGLIKEGINISDIAVLVRKTEESTLVSEWLLEEGFPVESEKTLNVKENSWIKEIVSLLKFLNSPLDNLSFASFVMGKIFLTKTKISPEEIQEFIMVKAQLSENVSLYEEFKKQYPKICEEYFSYLFRISGFLPTYNLLLEIYNLFDLKNNPEFIKNYAFFEHLLELAKKSEEKSSLLSHFISFLETLPEEELHINAKAEKSIKVLTIHKAKGLEFGIVIIPFLKIEIEVGKHKEITSNFLINKSKNKLEVVKVNKEIVKFSNKLKELYESEFENLLIDEMNVLYVAFTRAKDQIYFFVPDENSNLATFLFPWSENKIERGKICVSKDEKSNTFLKTFVLETPLFNDWRGILVEERISKEEVLNRDKILQGELLHKILSFLGNLSDKNLLKEIELAVKKTKRFFRITDAESKLYIEKVYNLVVSKELKEIFFLEQEDKVFCEQEVVSSNKEIKRIDRLVVKKDNVIIVDYKLSFKKKFEEYKKQLDEYGTLIEEIYKKPIKKYIVFLDSCEVVKI